MNVSCTVPIRQLVLSSTPEAEAELEPDAPIIIRYGAPYAIRLSTILNGTSQRTSRAIQRT